MENAIVIGVGGFFGAISRYGMALWIGERWGRIFPLGTLVINITGSFFIGLLMYLLAQRLLVNSLWRSLLVIGFLGAFTTFSTFEYETGNLIGDGELLFASINIVASVGFGFAALKLGELIARNI
ncbi:MAG: fluoride efflux transporter CrcB [Actinobacteria bacterium]|nr:fluoride efflux transporter CrcB [Actinomycetota bacterium]